MTAESAPITGAELDALQALADAATSGPWLYQDYFSNVYTDYTGITVHIAKCNSQQIDNGVSEADANAKFIADARVAVPRLIAEVRRLRAFREHVAGMLCVPGASDEGIFRTLKPINDYRSKNWKRCKRYAAPPAMPKRID